MRILLIEDDLILGPEMKIALERANFQVDLATDRWSGESGAIASRYSVILLDLNLPDGNGLRTLKLLRSRGSDTPIVVVTAVDDQKTIVAALNDGADDYIKKPFDIDELIARIKAACRRGERRSSNILKAGRIEIDPDAGIAWYDGREVGLTLKELAVLSLLTRKAGSFVSRQQVESELYDDATTIQSNTVETAIYSLRRKLAASAVLTSRGLGYMVPRQ